MESVYVQRGGGVLWHQEWRQGSLDVTPACECDHECQCVCVFGRVRV